MNEILQKRTKIERQIYLLKRDLENLQEECIHEHKRIEHKSDTGNYDPSDDIYWVEHECFDCGKFWMEYL